MRQAKLKTRGVAIAASAAALTVGATGCGGSDSPAEPAEPAVIPAKVASKLADRSDEIGTLVSSGDTDDLCDAAQKADELADEVEKAGDEIPAELRTQLEQATEQLVNTVNCPPPPEPEKKPKKEKDEEHGGEEGGYGDAPLVGEGDGPGNSEQAPGHNKHGD